MDDKCEENFHDRKKNQTGFNSSDFQYSSHSMRQLQRKAY